MHRAAEGPCFTRTDTHGGKSEEIAPKPGRPQRLFFQPSTHACLPPASGHRHPASGIRSWCTL